MGCCWGTRKQQNDLDNDIELQKPLLDDEQDLISIVIHDPEPLLQPTKVSLQLPSDKVGLDSKDTPLPPVFYVIVGCGPAAVINHTTLRQTKFGQDRFTTSAAGRLPVLHIGFANPWSRYMRHGMGQPPHLLSLPGFDDKNQPCASTSTIDGGLNSVEFGACIDREFKRCLTAEEERWAKEPLRTRVFKDFGWPRLSGWVAFIQSRTGMEVPDAKLKKLFDAEVAEGLPAAVWEGVLKALDDNEYPHYPEHVAPYRLVVVDAARRKAHLVYAQFIDLCTGSGRPNLAALTKESAGYAAARTPPWLDPETLETVLGDRKILTGMDAIRSEVRWSDGQRVCVTQGGGIGLNCAEKAQGAQCWLDWFHTGDLLATFANPRNYTFLKHWNKNHGRDSGEKQHETLTEAELIGHGERVRMGRDVVLKSVTPGHHGVDVVLEARPQGKDRRGNDVAAGNPHIRDNTGATRNLHDDGYWLATTAWVDRNGPAPSTRYDRVALPNGLFGDRLGQAWSLADHLAPTTPIEASDRMVGLQTANGAIRLLGAAAQTYPEFDVTTYDAKKTTPKDKMWKFRTTLPVSAVPDGFILSGINIAAANTFETPRNLNTMTKTEIENELKRLGAKNPPGLAQTIHDGRNANNGFKDRDDLLVKLTVGSGDVPDDVRFT